MLQITSPTLVIDPEKAKRNISRMIMKAEKAEVAFRPHFKTHQSVEIGQWFAASGVTRIAVSSVSMAGKFAQAGWTDILVAIPVNLNEYREINDLASAVRLGLTVECDITVAMLDREITQDLDVYIELDTGYHRTGIVYDQLPLIDRTVHRITSSKKMRFAGFLIHAGETYQVEKATRAQRRQAILDLHHLQMERLQRIRERYMPDYPDLVISYGDTPGCSLADDFSAATEIRPGNFIFYDLVMEHLGVCDYGDIAVAAACPVIGIYPSRQEVAIYGGAVHFSKDFLVKDQEIVYGELVQSSSLGWGNPVKGAWIRSLSQEHGMVRFSNEPAFRRVGIGDLLWFFPVHSCLTADKMGGYLSLNGEKILI